MIPDHMTQHSLIGFLIVARNADTAFMDAALPEDGNSLLIRFVYDFLLQRRIMQIICQNNHGSEAVETNQLIDASGDIFSVLSPVIVHGAVENNDAVSVFASRLIQLC